MTKHVCCVWMSHQCVNSPDIRHPCNLNPLREPFAKRQCGILLSEVFQVCHPVVSQSQIPADAKCTCEWERVSVFKGVWCSVGRCHMVLYELPGGHLWLQPWRRLWVFLHECCSLCSPLLPKGRHHWLALPFCLPWVTSQPSHIPRINHCNITNNWIYNGEYTFF